LSKPDTEKNRHDKKKKKTTKKMRKSFRCWRGRRTLCGRAPLPQSFPRVFVCGRVRGRRLWRRTRCRHKRTPKQKMMRKIFFLLFF
jgi:hypothetical protein